MLLSRDQVRSLALSGTISVPATFPELGELFLLPGAVDAGTLAPGKSSDLLRVVQRSSVKLSITRNFLLGDVAAVFFPADHDLVQLERGVWLLGMEVGDFFRSQSVKKGASNRGIAYVQEAARCLMQVEVAMTAAESAEYYPPLPGDRSVDHYRFKPESASAWMSSEPCTVEHPPGERRGRMSMASLPADEPCTVRQP